MGSSAVEGESVKGLGPSVASGALVVGDVRSTGAGGVTSVGVAEGALSVAVWVVGELAVVSSSFCIVVAGGKSGRDIQRTRIVQLTWMCFQRSMYK